MIAELFMMSAEAEKHCAFIGLQGSDAGDCNFGTTFRGIMNRAMLSLSR